MRRLRGTRIRKRLLNKKIRRMGKAGEVHNRCSYRKVEGRAKDYWTVSEMFVQIMARNHWIYPPFRANMYLPKGKIMKTEDRT